MDAEIRQRLQGADIDFLTKPGARVGRERLHKCGEVPNAIDIQAREHLQAQRGDIYPLVWGVLRGPVVEIEPIYINIRANSRAPQKQSRLSAARALSPKIEGVSK